jgi:hypothetical protein
MKKYKKISFDRAMEYGMGMEDSKGRGKMDYDIPIKTVKSHKEWEQQMHKKNKYKPMTGRNIKRGADFKFVKFY